MDLEVIPAILAKDKDDLLHRVLRVKDVVKCIQIDIMDGVFVPNRTVGLEALVLLPPLKQARYEFHWMVKDPINWIKKISEKLHSAHIHLVHVETISSPADFAEISSLIKTHGATLGLAINPETDLALLLPYLIGPHPVSRVLIMTVHPGFSGQSYIPEAEEKIRILRRKFPTLDIEVDGGINLETVGRAYASGANLLAAASAIFSAPDVRQSICALRERALSQA